MTGALVEAPRLALPAPPPRPAAPPPPAPELPPAQTAPPAPVAPSPTPAAERPALAPTADASANAGLWDQIVKHGSEQGPLLRALLLNSMLVEIRDDTAVLACSAKVAAGAPKWATAVAGVFTKVLGRTMSVEFLAPTQPAPGASPAPGDAAAAGAHAGSPPPRATNVAAGVEHPLVQKAVELFSARVVDVQPPIAPR